MSPKYQYNTFSNLSLLLGVAVKNKVFLQLIIGRALEKNLDGGMHHICFDVKNLIASRDKLIAAGGRVLDSNEPRIGAHGKPVIFIHPKDLSGTLIELQQA